MDRSRCDLYRRFDGPIPDELEEAVRSPTSNTNLHAERSPAEIDRLARTTTATIAERRYALIRYGAGSGSRERIDGDDILGRLTLRLQRIRRLAEDIRRR